MNKNQAIDKAGELQGKLAWHEKDKFPLEERYVIMVTAEEKEPLFWNNDLFWIAGVEDAQIYPCKSDWLPKYNVMCQVEYVLPEFGMLKEIEWKLAHDEFPPETNERGNIIERYKLSLVCEDYYSAWKMYLARENGVWEHLPTKQDAHYYRIWYNLEQMKFASFVEGDFEIVICETIDKFCEELMSLLWWVMDASYFYELPDLYDIRIKLKEFHSVELTTTT